MRRARYTNWRVVASFVMISSGDSCKIGASVAAMCWRSEAAIWSGDAKTENTGVLVTSKAPLRSRMLPRTAGRVIVSSW